MVKKPKETQKKPKNHKRNLTELRTEFREAVKAGNEQRAWNVSQLYSKRKMLAV